MGTDLTCYVLVLQLSHRKEKCRSGKNLIILREANISLIPSDNYVKSTISVHTFLFLH